MQIKINSKLSFSTVKRPILIAEISANHNHSKLKFLKHIRAAHEIGADLIKIQTYEPEDITLKSNMRGFKIKSGIWKNSYLWDIYKKACTPYSWHSDAFKLAKKIGATLFSTPFSEKAVNFLEKFGVPLYKLASLEITDVNLVKRIAQTKKPIIVSTGAAQDIDIKRCLKIIKRYHNKIILLHCVSEYPTANKKANIKKILKLKKVFKTNFVGLSDHTSDIHSSLAAVPFNIVAIEKHFKISKNLRSLDSSFSLNPQQFQQLKLFSSKIFETLGGEKDGKIFSKSLRRSIYAKINIKKGEKLSKKNIVSLRPKIGICASNYFKIIGKKINKDVRKNHPLKLKDLS